MGRWFRRSRSGSEAGRLDFEGYEVPNFPATIHDTLRLIRADESSNADIAEGLAADPGMTVRILRLVNSAGFGLRQAVDDVSQAVQLIGRSSLESILISAAVHETLPRKSKHGFDANAFWQLCAQRAAVAGSLAGELCSPRRSLCWTAGLLQDLAIPLLVEQEGPVYGSILQDWREGHEPLDVLEREVLGADHTEIARRVCELWEFPAPLIDAIATHHTTDDDEPRPERLVALLRPGDASGPDGEPGGLSEVLAAAEQSGLEADAAAGCVERGLAEAAPLFALLQ